MYSNRTGRLCLGLRAGNSRRYSNRTPLSWPSSRTPLPWPSSRHFTQVLQQDASASAFEQAIHAGTPTCRTPLPWPSSRQFTQVATPTGRLCLGLRAGNSRRYSNRSPLPWPSSRTPLSWPSSRQFTQVLQQDASALAFEQAIHAGTPTGRLCLRLRAGNSRRYSNRAHHNASLHQDSLPRLSTAGLTQPNHSTTDNLSERIRLSQMARFQAFIQAVFRGKMGSQKSGIPIPYTRENTNPDPRFSGKLGPPGPHFRVTHFRNPKSAALQRQLACAEDQLLKPTLGAALCLAGLKVMQFELIQRGVRNRRHQQSGQSC